MLRIVTGPFHPNLEHALVEDVSQLKSEDALAPLAIVVPSTSLLTYVRHLLVVQSGLSLLNVHFVTFHQLARRLYDERRRYPTAKGAIAKIEPLTDFFFEHVIRHLVCRQLKAVESLEPRNPGPGAWAALWASVEDLKQAAVEPAVVLQALEEGLFGSDEQEKLRALLFLYGAVVEGGRQLEVGTLDDLGLAALPAVPRSLMLSQLRRVCYYGFYDLNQVQLSLLDAVQQHCSVTLYFPLCEGHEYSFARRFYERYLTPLAAGSQQVEVSNAAPRIGGRAAERVEVEVISTVGPEDELTVVCKQILMLVETHGYQFDDIGVVARSLDAYEPSLRRILDEHAIPFTTTALGPVIREPAVKALLTLAALPITDFSHQQVVDVLTSPFAAMPFGETEAPGPRPELWGPIVQSLGIVRGEQDWQRLGMVGQLDVRTGVRGLQDQDPPGPGGIELSQAKLLGHLVRDLIEDCRAFPAQGTYGELTEAFRGLVLKYLTVPGLSSEWEEDDESSQRLGAIGGAVRESLVQLSSLDRLGLTVAYADWRQALHRVFESATIPVDSGNHSGVRVLDAMAARGLSFRALFVLGLNEKVFPRVIREDPFLRDQHRRVFETTLGYKIDEKLTAYEEEQLLFALLKTAARSRLYLLYQRADAEGRPMAPSPYLVEFDGMEPALGAGAAARLPRRLTGRLTMPWFTPALLTRREQTLRLLYTGFNASPVFAAAGGDRLLFDHGLRALKVLEQEHKPGSSDGITGQLEPYWTTLAMRGLSPTSLEQYARCPFQYFTSHVLNLEPIRQVAPEELSTLEIGRLCHALLRVCYERLIARSWPQRTLEDDEISILVREAAGPVFATYAASHGTGYPLVWAMTRELIERVVTSTIRDDEQDCRRTGYVPAAFEVEAEGQLGGGSNAEGAPLRVMGRVDRLDQRTSPPGLRVVDYKYRPGRKTAKGDLLTSAIRGRQLQPALYTKLERFKDFQTARVAHAQAESVERVEFLYLTPDAEAEISRARFESAWWETGAGKQLGQTVKALVEGIEGGRYFILPDDEYCGYCDFSSVCRRFHRPSWWRAYRASLARELRQLRKQKVVRD